ncbi:hypothetical protein JL720_681 [Aureococcus anophagefferens]|nr:hypothetical protein JL720_681 [Aureococcus anophagefferens]
MAALERALELEIDAGAALEDEGPSRDASVADSEEDAYERARLLETAELCRMRLAEHDQRVLERAASFDDCECPLSTVLRGVLFARGRRIAGDGIASDWARSLLLCVFRCHAGPDKRWGLEEWCCFVADCKFPSEDAPRLFRRVALQRAAPPAGPTTPRAPTDASDDDGDGDGVAALVAAGIGARGPDARGATRVDGNPLLAERKTLLLLATYLPNLWQLFTLYAQDERGHTAPRGNASRSRALGFPHLAQAAEHAVAGVELRDPASDRFLRLCEDLALVPAVATAALGRKCYKDAEAAPAALGEAASPAKKRASPTKKPRPHFQSPILRTTAAHRRRMLATASQTSSLHATRDGHARATPRSKAVRANVSLALEQTKARGPRSVASTLAREIDLTTEACPGLSFCEFVDALLSVADGAIGARETQGPLPDAPRPRRRAPRRLGRRGPEQVRPRRRLRREPLPREHGRAPLDGVPTGGRVA